MTELTFTRLSEQPPAESEKGMIYGGSGAGKTAIFGSLGSRSLILNTGAGLDTLKSPWFQREHPGVDPMVIDIIEKIDAAGNVTEAIAYDVTCDAIDYAIAKLGDDFDNVIVDDATALQNHAMNKVQEIAVATGLVKKTYKKLEKASSSPEELDKIMTEVQEWQGQMNLTYKFFRGTIDICVASKKNLWVGAHEKFIYKIPRDDRGKPIIGGQPEVLMCYPAFTGKQYPDSIQSMFDDVWHLEAVDNETRRLRIKRSTTNKYGDVMAKTRHDGVFTDRKGESVEYIDNPDLSRMMSQIRSSYAPQLKSVEAGHA